MNFAWAELRDLPFVLFRRIAGVFGEAISGVFPVKLFHQPIPPHFGQDRRRRNLDVKAIAADDRPLRAGGRMDRHISINQDELSIAQLFNSLHCQAHGLARRFSDIHLVDSLVAHRDDGPGCGFVFDDFR